MLSKSAARLFFLGGTAVFSLVFLALTIDTLRQIPKRSNAEDMTDAVKRGHDLWTFNNCMGCHTLLGEGAYYAPELTKVVERRGKPWIRIFLKDPEAMFPGRRKMINYGFNDGEIEDLLAFFEWVGRIDTNGFPPEPDLAEKIQATQVVTRQTTSDHKALPQPEMFRTICMSCHALGGKGGVVGPALDTVAAKYSRAQLDLWLKNPQEVKPGTSMPKLPMDDTVRRELVDFLLSYQGGNE
ncbi:c-type cytochrome [Acanthopleuribacter pedis]|uniref:Cytochrome c n=1 Tax=Acanthopleuribacter pedis TaxID=442870 RepID=A0A8J7QIB0_9BACT|nr:cytochrome c [Acanthopleuribacter pedis]MBO1318773.1 cytochrome c [Acanthopleuribacter pedis]